MSADIVYRAYYSGKPRTTPAIIICHVLSALAAPGISRRAIELLSSGHTRRILGQGFFRIYARALLTYHSGFSDYATFPWYGVTITLWPDVIHNFCHALSREPFRAAITYFAAAYINVVQRNFRETETVIALGQTSCDSATSIALRNYPECELAERYVCRFTLTSSNFNRFRAQKLSRRLFDRSFFFFANSREICNARRSSKSRSQNG